MPADFLSEPQTAQVFRDISGGCAEKRAFAGKRYDNCSLEITTARSNPQKPMTAQVARKGTLWTRLRFGWLPSR